MTERDERNGYKAVYRRLYLDRPEDDDREPELWTNPKPESSYTMTVWRVGQPMAAFPRESPPRVCHNGLHYSLEALGTIPCLPEDFEQARNELLGDGSVTVISVHTATACVPADEVAKPTSDLDSLFNLTHRLKRAADFLTLGPAVTGSFFRRYDDGFPIFCLTLWNGLFESWTVADLIASYPDARTDVVTDETAQWVLPSHAVRESWISGKEVEPRDDSIHYRWHHRGLLVLSLSERAIRQLQGMPFRLVTVSMSGIDHKLPVIPTAQWKVLVDALTLPSMRPLLSLRYWAALLAETDFRPPYIILPPLALSNVPFIHALVRAGKTDKSDRTLPPGLPDCIWNNADRSQMEGPRLVIGTLFHFIAWPLGSLEPEIAARALCFSELYRLDPLEILDILEPKLETPTLDYLRLFFRNDFVNE